MTTQQTRTHLPTQPAQVLDSEPAGGSPSGLLQQAATYGNIARQALENCQLGLSADEALRRRRNQSGQ